MALLSYALVTEAEAKAAIRLGTSYTTDETLMLHAFVNGVTEACEGFTRRPIVARQFTETSHGRGSSKLFLKRRPVTTLTSLRALDALGNTLQAFVASDYFLDTAAGIVGLRVLSFPPGQYNIEAVYTAGWAAVPADIKASGLQWITRLYRDWKTDRQPIASQSVQGTSTVYLNEHMPKFMEKTLERYRLSGVAVG